MKTKDEEKTREQLIDELAELRKKVAELQKTETERKRAEEALKKSEERFRTSAETLLGGFAILSAVRDSNGQIIDFKYEYINEAGCKMNQKPHEEHMGKTLLELLPTHKEIGLFDEYVRVVETGQSLTKEFLIYETVYGSGERLRQAFDVQITRLGDGFVTTWQDITDKKKGEELLRRSEERLKLLIENSKDVVIMVDLEGSLIYYNGPPEYGITAEEALGKNPFSIFEPAIAASLMNQLKLVIKGGEALTFENNIPLRGESFWFLNQMYPIRDEKGRMIAVGLIARNITERKLVEEALRESEEKYRILVERANDGIAIVQDTMVKYVNPSLAEAVGYTIEELIGTSFADYVHPDDLPKVVDRYKRRMGGEDVTPVYEIAVRRKDGSNVYVEANAGIITYQGKPAELVIVRDLTERKRAEEVLRESEAKYRTLVERLQEGVYQSDIEGNYITLNQAGVEIFGFDFPEQIVGKLKTANLYIDVSERAEIIEEIRRTGSSLREVQARKRDGTMIWLLVNNNARRDEAGNIVGYEGAFSDITERKRAEEALRESEARFSTIFHASPVSIAITRLKDGQIMDVNDSWQNVSGLTREEAIGHTPIELNTWVNPGDRDRFISKLREQGTVQDFEFQVRHKSGIVSDMLMSAELIELADERYVLSLAQNITERKRIEKSLMESERKLRLITENMRDTVFAYDMERRLQYVNPAFETLTGYTCQELYERNFINYIHPEDEARMLQLWEELFQGKEIFNEEFRIVAKDGQIKWCSSSWAPLLDGKRKQVGVQGRETDITERKWAEEALQESKELFEKTFISQPDAIFLLDAINPPRILDCNPAATEVFGYPRQEMVGRTTDFLHVDETALKEFRGHLYPTIADHGFMHLFEFRMKRKDGTVFPTEHSVIPLEDEQGKRIGWVSVVRDITERKQSAERILTYQEQLRSLTSELSLIEERERRHIATELHDNISQTLAITKIKLGMAQGLTSSTDWVGSLNEIGELIDQAIQYTRSLTFELSPPILYELGLEAGIEWLTEQIQEKHGIQIGFEDDRQPKPMNEEIRLTLFKATRELLINIVKHAQASKAKVSIWREDNSIRIRVEDDGVGFSTSEDKQLGKTTGFGLFNIRERIKYLGGDMVIESEPGRGTRVTLSAPLEEKED